jgi:TRAP transporter 4TM/12TM fusion protein
MTRDLRARAVFWTALAFGLFQLVVPVFVPLYDMQLRALHVLLGVATVLIAMPVQGRGLRRPLLALDIAMIALAAAANVLIFLDWESILTLTGEATLVEHLLGAALALILLESARRATGWAIPVLVLAMFAYVFVGPWMPGMWTHPGFPLAHVIETLYYSSSGIYGSLTGTSATFIAMFILFGALLEATGGGKTFMDLALWMAGRFRGGPAKVCVVSSALFGMVSGSAVANVAVTGNYTIPLMRKLGYDRNFAGGVESMSSIGGSLSPPIMGIATFIMADFLGVPYIEIMGYATIPCILFYIGIMAGVHFEAARIGLAPVPPAEVPKARDIFTWAKTVPLFLPIAVLMGLLFADMTLMSAGFWSCVSVILLYVSADLSPAGMRQRSMRLLHALAEGGVSVARIVPILVSVGMFVALMGLTGIAPKVSSVILEMGGANLFGALLVAAIIPLGLGGPLPVSATYILSAALVAPAMVKVGVDVVAAHMFLLYWATLASVTPPTCTACVIAANIAEGNWFKTSVVGMKLGIVAFLVPFFFAVNPALIGRGPAGDVLLYAVGGVAGAILMAAGFFGYFRSRLNGPLRLLYFAAGALLLAPGGRLLAFGAALAAAAFAIENTLIRRRTAATSR